MKYTDEQIREDCAGCESMAQMIEILEARQYIPTAVINAEVSRRKNGTWEAQHSNKYALGFIQGAIFAERYLRSFATMSEKARENSRSPSD